MVAGKDGANSPLEYRCEMGKERRWAPGQHLDRKEGKQADAHTLIKSDQQACWPALGPRPDTGIINQGHNSGFGTEL